MAFSTLKKKNIKYSCITNSSYSLLLYLLCTEDETFEKTVFFVSTELNKDLIEQIPNAIAIDNKFIWSKWQFLLFRIKTLIKWRFRDDTLIYAQDALCMTPALIGSNKYICLEDSPGILTYHSEHKNGVKPFSRSEWWWKVYRDVFHGPIYFKIYGTNNQCIDRIVTRESDLKSSFVSGMKTTLVNLRELWENASVRKQEAIKKVYDISNDLLTELSKCKTIILTNPFMSDCKMTEEEVVEIYRPYIKDYANEGVVIKPHPRDKVRYSLFFPDVKVLNTTAPMQLLVFMGVKIKNVITPISSAVSEFSKDTNIIWLGAKVHPKVEKISENNSYSYLFK